MLAKFSIAHPDVTAENELPPNNVSGRQSNRGFEGLAVSPDGAKFWAIRQSPLIQNGALNAKRERFGTNIRILEITIETGAIRELVYRLEIPKHGVNEILSLSDHELVVLERDRESGSAGTFRTLFRVDLSRASDASETQSLPAGALSSDVLAVSKSAWLDFFDPRFGVGGKEMPEKIEGLSFGPCSSTGAERLW